jgi:LDH2 family malate/lactate/ureidoglycolate dehydrogenase
MSADDRAYLLQQVAGATGLAGPDAERRVDSVIANAKMAGIAAVLSRRDTAEECMGAYPAPLAVRSASS